jgi:Fanconi anemia group J protein
MLTPTQTQAQALTLVDNSAAVASTSRSHGVPVMNDVIVVEADVEPTAVTSVRNQIHADVISLHDDDDDEDEGDNDDDRLQVLPSTSTVVVVDLTDSEGDDDDNHTDTTVDSDFASPKRRVKRQVMSPAKKGAVTAKNSVAMMQEVPPMTPANVPRIFYATRTHNQLAQVVRELKRTSYTPHMVVLASRDRYCINPAVKKRATRPNSAGLNAECFAELDSPASCRFARKARLDDLLQDPTFEPPSGTHAVWDIEDLLSSAHNHGACPYFATRAWLRESKTELILCPYNYLIDPAIRTALGIEVQNDIVILDEAHNIESICRDAASLTLDASALHDLQHELFAVVDPDGDYVLDAKYAAAFAQTIQFVGSLATLMLGIELELASARGTFDGTTRRWTGDEIARYLHDKVGIGAPAIAQAEAALVAVIEHALASEPLQPHVSFRACSQLQALITVLHNVMDEMWRGAYRMVAERRRRTEAERAALRRRPRYSRTADAVQDTLERLDKDPNYIIELHFWCMSSAVAFEPLRRARCTLLTSGTLSPLSSFACELGVPFEVNLEASHVIDVPRQVFAAAVPRGPHGAALRATYNAIGNVAYQDELAALLTDVFDAAPNGVLVFFPSYYALDLLVRRWQSTGAWETLQQRKSLHVEPGGEAKRNGAAPFEETLAQYFAAARSARGGALLGVFRGKVSEGTDFANEDARAVVLVGIPFPNSKDLRVQMKREYNDLHRARLGTGSAWYALQAYRALNQALGRGIRNLDDWCALLLVDDRHNEVTVASVSKWLRGAIVAHDSYREFVDGMRGFFTRQITAATPEPAAESPPPPTAD